MKRQLISIKLLLMGALFALAACAGSDALQPATVYENEAPHPPVQATRIVTEVEYAVEEEAAEDTVAPSVEAQQMEAPQEPEDMFFENYGTNPFIDTRADNLSTFAIDVDTGSYTVMRRYLTDSLLPPQEAVRVEEFINYFAQEYELPQNGAFNIDLEAAPAPYGESENYHLLRVGIQGYDVAPEERPDAMLIFVVDVSGSMDSGNRLGLVKESLHLLVDNLRPSDQVGIVTYGSQAEIILEPTAIANAPQLHDAIDRLHASGGTNMDQGLAVAYELASQYSVEGNINRLIVASDGVANIGATTAEEILNHAREGIQLSTFGFGMGNYNDINMEQLADRGDGSYAYIDTLDEAERVFQDQLLATILTIAKDAKIQVDFNPAVVERYRLIGYENRDVADEDFRNDDVDAGEIGAGHSVTALYEVRFAEDANPAEAALTVRVRYADPQTSEVTEISEALALNEVHAEFTDASPRFQLTAVVAEYAEILRDSFWAQDSELNAIALDARRIAEYMPQDADVQEFSGLVSIAATLSE